MNLNEVQKRIINNKIKYGFNTTDLKYEFCLLYGEVAEAFDAYNKNQSREDLGSELADAAIYLLGISELLGFSLEDEISKKLAINENREYELVNGTMVKKKKNEN